MKIRKLFLILLPLITASLICLPSSNSVYGLKAEAENAKTKEVPTVLYESLTDNGYAFNDDNIVSCMSIDSTKVGSLTISGLFNSETTFRNFPAFGTEGLVSFSYSFDKKFMSGVKEEWNIKEDKNKVVNENTLTGSIKNGAMIIEKSYDGVVWNYAANPITDFYASNPDGVANFYTPSGEDLSNGVYLRFTFAYHLQKKTGTSGFWIFKQDTFDKRWCVELYSLYLLNNKATFSIHNLSVDKESLKTEDFDINVIQKGETLLDGNTTLAGFSIDKTGLNTLVSVKKNNEDLVYANDGDTFLDNGLYTITSTTRLGLQETRTVYVFNGGEDHGYSTYFNQGFPVVGERMFRYLDYPVFHTGSYLHIKEISEFVPSITGSIVNLNTSETIVIEKNKRQEHKYFLEEGIYCASFYSGNTETGSFYEYIFTFAISDEEAGPYLNKYQLFHSERLCDLKAKHYEVAYQTTLGGYIFVCFSLDSYDDAFRYAYEIEKRFIEKADDGNLIYKSADNPNIKVKYIDDFELVKVLNNYAKLNVEINCFDATETFTFRTYEDNLLQELEKINVSESIRVFPNQAEKEKIIDRTPYLNGFQFVSIADYECVKVKAFCHNNGITYNIDFLKDISQQLVVSSKYTITEINSFGSETVYDAYYINENQTNTTWELSLNDITNQINISAEYLSTNGNEFTADYVRLSDYSDFYDSNSIVTIQAPNTYSYELKCLVSELKNLTLYKKGDYTLKFIDRNANTYKVIFHITGNKKYTEIFTETSINQPLYAIYNRSHFNQIDDSEEVVYSRSELSDLVNREVISSLYTESSFQVYSGALFFAHQVLDNTSSSQGDINKASKGLVKAFNQLVLKHNKEDLLDKINHFEALDEDLYTTSSYQLLKTVYLNCVQTYNNQQATEEDISNAVYEYDVWFAALVLKGNMSALLDRLDVAKGIDVSEYTPDTTNNLNYVYLLIVKTINSGNLDQEEIDYLLELLNQSLDGLVVMADFSKLELALRSVPQIEQLKYTAESYNRLYSAYNAALSVNKNRNSNQEAVNSAFNELTKAINKLVLAGDSKQIKETMNSIAALNQQWYESSGINAIYEKYQEALEAVNGRAKQSILDELNNELQSIKATLVLRVNKQELSNVIQEFLSINPSHLSAEQAKKYKDLYEEIVKTYNNLDATDEEVNDAIDRLKNAIDDVKADEQKNLKDEKSLQFFRYPLIFYIVAGIVLFIWLMIVSIYIGAEQGSFFKGFIFAIVFSAVAIPEILFITIPWWAVALIVAGSELVLTIISVHLANN